VLVISCMWMDAFKYGSYRLLGIGLASGLRQGYGSAYLKPGCKGIVCIDFSFDRVATDSTIVKARKEGARRRYS